MGKRYYCDYCDNTMVSSVSIIKTHNKGIPHQKMVQEHYYQYKEPEEILAEERNKTPCHRYVKGTCTFGRLCRFSHYTRDEINALRELVEAKRQEESNVIQPSFQDLYHKLQTEKCNEPNNSQENILIDENGVTHILPWHYNEQLDRYNDLPPSIKRFKAEHFKDIQLTEWG